MIPLTPETSEWLYALQRPWPLCERPLAALAETLGTTEQALLQFLNTLRAEGFVRRIGAVFDARRLGYRSCLYAVHVADEAELHAAAQLVCAQPGVTHAYVRGWDADLALDGITAADYADYPQLWYTLSARGDRFDEATAPLAHLRPIPFPATKRYKIDVVFDSRTRSRDERTEYRTPDSPLPTALPTAEEQAIVRRYQGDTIDPTAPFRAEDLPTLQAWQTDGTLRRFALLLRHRASGFTANGMCCWCVPEAELDTFGRRLAQDPDVTHCYARPTGPNFPFNLYAMIHKHSWREGLDTFYRLTDVAQLPAGGKIFFSTREFKKSSLQCFIEP